MRYLHLLLQFSTSAITFTPMVIIWGRSGLSLAGKCHVTHAEVIMSVSFGCELYPGSTQRMLSHCWVSETRGITQEERYRGRFKYSRSDLTLPLLNAAGRCLPSWSGMMSTSQTLMVLSRSQNGSLNIVCKYEKYLALSIFQEQDHGMLNKGCADIKLGCK